MVEIDFSLIEKKWQKKWEDYKVFEAKENNRKKKFYVLEMFPYPSASGLHMGHAWNYTIGDIYARYKKMQGFNVLHPMGFDSFGLPAENAAIKAKSHPKKFTEEAIHNYIRQLKNLGLSYDWSRMIETHKPEYYRWDQWIFLKMLEKGLVYRKEAPVNWCRECNTVLANEQVVGGKCWIHTKTDVEIRHLEQWFLKTTAYAQELYDGLEKLDDWPENIRILQKNWINRSEGTEIIFKIKGKKWPIFTTRPDTLFGVTFLVISAQHPKLMEVVAENRRGDVNAFLKKINSTKQEDMEKLEKEGVFTGEYAIHPLTGEEIPVWVGNFVLAEYGSGIVMAVPAHDQRDFEFAKKYKIPIKIVIKPEKKDIEGIEMTGAYVGEGILVNSGDFDGLFSEEAKEHITKVLQSKNLGRKAINYKLRDWLISRQRFWGTPIPIIYCERCGILPVPESDLPVKLPEDVKFNHHGNPLASHSGFVNVKCHKCGGDARRETDTMDTFVNSSWYYLRYCDPKNKKEIFDREKAEYWTPIDLYIGGKEHACLHLIYIRFYTKFLRDIGLIKINEPAKRLFNQGMLLGPDGEKMSKSKGNVVLPEVISNKIGIDAARFFLASIASPDKDISWSDAGADGSLRFIKRIFDFAKKVRFGKSSRRVESRINKAIKDISLDIEYIKYNFAAIKLREVFDRIEQEKEIAKGDWHSFIKLLSPFCPHIAEELWEMAGGRGFVSSAEWPLCDEKKIDEKLEESEKNAEKAVFDILNVIKIVREKKGEEPENVYLYVMPFEIDSYNKEYFEKRLGKKVNVFAVNDKNRYDPDGRASKAKPGKPGIFVE